MAQSKSECMRFVHSCCSLVLFCSRNALDSGCDLRRLIEMGQLVQPWSVCVAVPYNLAHQVTSALPCVVPCTLVMHITQGPLSGIGTGPIRWQPQQHKAWGGAHHCSTALAF